MEWLGLISSVISIVTALAAIASWWQSRKIGIALRKERERQNQSITIKLQCGVETYELPNKIRRAEFERNEILGRLGMIPMAEGKKGTRFAIDYLISKDFLRQIDAIRDGQGDMLLTIPCTLAEFQQFNLKRAFEWTA